MKDLFDELSGATLVDVTALMLLPVVRGVYAALVRAGIARVEAGIARVED
jgi:hypothetical protein